MGRGEESEQLTREHRRDETRCRPCVCVCVCVCMTRLTVRKEGKTCKKFFLFFTISSLTTSYSGKLSFTFRDGGPN